MSHYYGDEEPDPSDIVRLQVIETGAVPATCKLGGTALLPVVNLKLDPCLTICPHINRDGPTGCGGRIKDKKLIIKDTDRFFKNARADSFKAWQNEQIKELSKLLGQAYTEPDPEPDGNAGNGQGDD